MEKKSERLLHLLLKPEKTPLFFFSCCCWLTDSQGNRPLSCGRSSNFLNPSRPQHRSLYSSRSNCASFSWSPARNSLPDSHCSCLLALLPLTSPWLQARRSPTLFFVVCSGNLDSSVSLTWIQMRFKYPVSQQEAEGEMRDTDGLFCFV